MMEKKVTMSGEEFVNVLAKNNYDASTFPKIFGEYDSLIVSGDIDLRNTPITQLPDNLVVDGYLNLSDTPITQLPDNLVVDRWIDLANTQITQLPDNFVIGGELVLSDTPITRLPDNLVVGYLNLENTQITQLPDNLVVVGALNLANTQITQLPDNLVVDCELILSNTQITRLPDNLIVGDFLDLENTPITQLPDNLIVGGNLHLENTQIAQLPDNLIVGGNLHLENTPIANAAKKVKRLHNGDYVEGKYLYADGNLTLIKYKIQVGDYTVYVGLIENVYVVSDGEYYGYGGTIREGIIDIIFKKADDRGPEQYRHLTPDSILMKDYAIAMYRVITGSYHRYEKVLSDILREPKELYTVAEIAELTKGGYKNDTFCKFFNLEVE